MKKPVAVTVPYVLLITTSLATAKDSFGTPCLGGSCHFPETNPREKSAEMTAKKQSGRRSKRAAIRRRNDLSNIWRDGVYYYYDATYISANRYKISAKKDRIRVLAYSHYCYSQLGKKGGEQNLVLGTGCESFGVTAHELGHALGLFHTMGRPDRDKHIQLHLYHIQQEVYRAEYNIRDERDSAHYGTGYDYGSIMHYPGSGYFSNYKPVSVPIDGRHQEMYKGEYNIRAVKDSANYGTGYDYGSIMHYPRSGHFSNYLPVSEPVDGKHVQTMGSEMISFADLSVINEHYFCKDTFGSARTVKCGVAKASEALPSTSERGISTTSKATRMAPPPYCGSQRHSMVL
ncbi:astacin [Oesophagostomum dentatum]|uniref:Metalloendopeptidase n=1 Tax=Oesophagostomum dentatum TaxID=61180 RepID=A0A0B1TDR2_OESDE|nr:astacin [Oesophagostomum dentatum]